MEEDLEMELALAAEFGPEGTFTLWQQQQQKNKDAEEAAEPPPTSWCPAQVGQ